MSISSFVNIPPSPKAGITPRPCVTISLTDSIVKFDTVSKFGPTFPSDPAAFKI